MALRKNRKRSSFIGFMLGKRERMRKGLLRPSLKIVNLDPINTINVEIQTIGMRCTYYRESNYYPNGDDRIHELVKERDGYEHVIHYRSRK